MTAKRWTADRVRALPPDRNRYEVIDGMPLSWSWRLSDATVPQRLNYEIICDGEGIHWPDIDEDISVRGMLHWVPSPRPRRV